MIKDFFMKNWLWIISLIILILLILFLKIKKRKPIFQSIKEVLTHKLGITFPHTNDSNIGLSLEVKNFDIKQDPKNKKAYIFNIDMMMRNTESEKRGIKKVEIVYNRKENNSTGFPIGIDFYIDGQNNQRLQKDFILEYKDLPLKILFEVRIIDYKEKAYSLILQIQPRELEGHLIGGFSVLQKLKPIKLDDFYKGTFGFN